MEALGLQADDPRGLTLTGGLPFFGGPGNNYSMHALAEAVQRCRAAPGSLGLVGANGGLMSVHAVGVYGTTPRAYVPTDHRALQRQLDAVPAPPFTHRPDGWATVESWTVLHDRNGPTQLLLVGRLQHSGERFIAVGADGDAATLAAFVHEDGAGRRVWVRGWQGRNVVGLSPQALQALLPLPRAADAAGLPAPARGAPRRAAGGDDPAPRGGQRIAVRGQRRARAGLRRLRGRRHAVGGRPLRRRRPGLLHRPRHRRRPRRPQLAAAQRLRRPDGAAAAAEAGDRRGERPGAGRRLPSWRWPAT